MNSEITNYIALAPDKQQDIMTKIRKLIHETVSDTVEEFKWSRPVFTKIKGFTYLLCNKNDVTVGFTKNIEKLEDPHGILQGSGTTMKYIKIKDPEEIDFERIQKWLQTMNE
jgi:hypothetical protein